MSNIPNFSDADSLLPVVVQDATSGKVLMMAYMNQAAWEQTLASGEAVYYSRSRRRLWKKGEASGHVQRVRQAYVDCDADAILLKVEQVGDAACHEGYQTCFFRQHDAGAWRVVESRVFDPQTIYPASNP